MIFRKKTIKIILAVLLVIGLITSGLISGCKTVPDNIGNMENDEAIGSEPGNTEEVTEEDHEEDPTIEDETIYTAIPLMDEDVTEYIASLDLGLDEFLDLTPEDREYLIGLVYDTISSFLSNDLEENKSYPSEYDNIKNEVHVILRVDGKQKGWNFATSSNLARSVAGVVLNILQDTKTDIDFIKQNLWDLGVEIIIKGEEKELGDESFERGIHGVIIRRGNINAIALSTLSVEGNYSFEYILRDLYEELGLDPEKEYEDVEEYYFPTIHFTRTSPDGEVINLYRCSETEIIPDVTPEKIFETIKLAEGWMLLNIDEDGYFNYGYSPSRGEYLTTNNMIRQFLSSRWLADKSKSDENLLYLHRINLEYILKKWYFQEGDLGYIYFGDKSKLGAMAMAISTIAKSPLYEDYAYYAEKLANTILSMQHEDGSFDAWFIEPDYAYDEDSLLRFYSGESMLGMLELYETSRDERYLEAMKLSQDFYIEKYVNNIDENYSPALVPWQTMSLSKLYMITGDRKYIEPIFILNDSLISMQNQTGEPYPDFLGRFFDPEHPEYGPPNSGSTSPYVESLAYAFEIAMMEGDEERMAVYKQAIILGIQNLMNCQFKSPDMYYLTQPERVEGALRYRMYDNRIRIDTTQHTIDALLKVVEVFELEEDMQ